MPQFVEPFIAPVRDNRAVPVLLFAVFIGILLDLVTGFIGAASRRELQSSKMREGLTHKVAEIILLAVADMLDGLLVIVDLGIKPVLVTSATIIAIMELISISENAVQMYPQLAKVPIVKSLIKLLDKYTKSEDSDV